MRSSRKGVAHNETSEHKSQGQTISQDNDPYICRVGDIDLSSEDSSKEEEDSKEGPDKSCHLSLVESRRGTGRAERRRPAQTSGPAVAQPTNQGQLPAFYCSCALLQLSDESILSEKGKMSFAKELSCSQFRVLTSLDSGIIVAYI